MEATDSLLTVEKDTITTKTHGGKHVYTVSSRTTATSTSPLPAVFGNRLTRMS